MAAAYSRDEVYPDGLSNDASGDAHRNGAPLHGADDGGATVVDQLREPIDLLWRNKGLFLGVALLVAGAGAAYTYTLPAVYRASSLLLVEPDQDASGEQISLQMSGSDRQQGAELSNEMLLINRSDELALRVAKRLLEMEDAPETGKPLQILRTERGEQLPAEKVAARLLQTVSARSGGRDADAIRIGATSTQPGEAAAIANVYSEEFIARSRAESRADVRGARSFLGNQAKRLRGRLDSLEDRLSDYMSENHAAALDQAASRTVERIAALEAQRDEARIEAKMKRASLEAKEEELRNIEPKLVERAASNVEAKLKRLQDQLVEKELRLDQIYEKNPALRDNPDAATREIKQEIEQLRARSRELSEQYVNQSLEASGIDPMAGGGSGEGGSGEGGSGEGGRQGLSYVVQQRREAAQARIAINGLEAKIRMLNERLGEYRSKLERIPRQSIQLGQIQRARQSAEKLYTFVIEKLQETRIREQSKIGYAEVVHAADVPGTPFKPNVRRNVVLSLFLGLLLGGGLVLLRERLDRRLRHPADLEEQGCDVAGVVPDLTSLIEKDFDGTDTVTVEGREVSTDLPMLLSPMSGAAEAFRRLRNTVQFSRPDTAVQALMVTSAGPGEGKTTTALNAAIAMAQAGRRTLVVGADLHRPRAHRILGEQGEPGLTDVLFERRPFEVSRIETGVDQLDLLPAGHEVPKPAELLGSEKMRRFVERVREEYDMVIFDTPPVGALSDAMLLATQCEGTLLVARAGETDARAFAQVAETLTGVGATLFGGVLNAFDPDREGHYGYYDGYGYHDRYGAGQSGYGEQRSEHASLPAT
jgi:capsular exopolysaccharide synthesis family protein